jgi:hypothetical protein
MGDDLIGEEDEMAAFADPIDLDPDSQVGSMNSATTASEESAPQKNNGGDARGGVNNKEEATGEAGDPDRQNSYYDEQTDVVVYNPNPTWKEMFASERFDHMMGTIIFLNILVMAIEYSFAEEAVDSQLRTWAIIDLIFLAIYTFELAAKYKCRTWFDFTKDRAMLTLDVTIVLVGFVTEILVPMAQGSFLSNTAKKTQAMQLLKMARVLRAVRILRILALFDEMRRMMILTHVLFQRMIWLAIFEIMVAFLFAMFSVVLIGQNLVDETPPVENPTTDDDVKLVQAWFNAQQAVKGFSKTTRAWYNMWLLEQGLRDNVAFDIMTYSFKESQYTWTYGFFVFVIAFGRIALFLVVQALLIVDGMDKILVLDSEDGARKWKQDIKEIKKQFNFVFDPNLDVKFLSQEDFDRDIWESRPFLEVMTTMGARKYDIPYMYPYVFNMINTRKLEKVSGGMDLLNEPRVTQKEFLYNYCKLRKLCEDASFIGAMRISNSSQERLFHMCVNIGTPCAHIEREIPAVPDPDDEGRTTDKGDPDGKPLNLVGQLKCVNGEKLELHPKFYNKTQRLVMNPFFNGFIGLFVLANCFIMAYEYELPENEAEDLYLTFLRLDLLFLLIFALELFARYKAFGWEHLVGHVMTALDIFIVGSGFCTEIILPSIFGTFLQAPAKDEGTGANEQAAENTDMLKLLKVLRVIRAIRILRMLDFFEGLYRAMSTFIDSIFILFWPMLYFFCINYLFALVTIFLIGRNPQFDQPRPVDTCSGCMDYEFETEQWHALQSAQAEMKYFHISFCAYFRMAFFSSDNILAIMDAQMWSIGYYLVYVYIVRLCIMMAFYSILQDMIIKDTDAEKFVLRVDEMVISINRMLRNILIGLDASNGVVSSVNAPKKGLKRSNTQNLGADAKARIITRDNFTQGYKYSPQFNAMQAFLRLADEDFPLIFDIVDVDGSKELSVPELVNMFRLLKFMVADSAVAVRIQNSDLQKQRIYIIENYFKTKQVAAI